jgi:hypothetical protein
MVNEFLKLLLRDKLFLTLIKQGRYVSIFSQVTFREMLILYVEA